MINWIKVEDRLPTHAEHEAYRNTFLTIDDGKRIDIGFLWEGESVFSDGDCREWPDITHWANLSDINLPNE